MPPTLTSSAHLAVERDGVRLACVDAGPVNGQPVLLLHGLAGHAGEWRRTIERLSGHCRLVAFDQRGHGASTRRPADVSRAAFVADAIAVIEQLRLPPVVVVGQSLGAHTAFLLAAKRPDLVAGVVVAEASPEQDRLARERLAVLLRAWPAPFASGAAALEFFGGDSLAGKTWLEGLEERGGLWWPRFECQTVLDALCEITERSFWSEWSSVRVPTLVVRGEYGWLDLSVAQEMGTRASRADIVEIAGAGHDVHLEQPEAWSSLVASFVSTFGERVAA